MARSEMSTWLTPAASEVVDKAAKHAKSKGHSQLQPLHVAAALLLQSGPGTALHNACLNSLKEAGLPPKDPSALDVCFRVALERLPVHIERIVNPGHSNALHAALKRAQANQRRGTLEQSLQPILAVQVEIEQLIISILDDPSVSRVFKEAGFSSPDVKANMEDAVAQASLSGPAVLDSNTLPRRVSVPMSPFSGASLETPAFRSSIFPSAAVGPVEQYTTNPGTHLERGRMSGLVGVQAERQPPFRTSVTRQDADSSKAFGLSSKFGENAAALQLRRHDQFRLQSSTLSRPPPVQEGSRPNEHIKRIVEILLCPTKKRNPVLVSDSDLHSVSGSVTKEFSHRLMKGDVPSILRGVQIKDLPVTSLSVGFLSREDVVQKLSKLRVEVDGCMPGGAIISVGDLQWLVETPQSGVHTHSQLVVQELQQMMTSHDRIWLLASASTETFLRCRLDPGRSLENQLGLEAVVVTALPHGGAPTPQSRHGRYQNSLMENSLYPQPYGKSAAALKQFGMDSELSADGARNFSQDCSKLRKDEQTTALDSGLAHGIELGVSGLPYPKTLSQMSWLVDQIESTRVPLLIKEENSPVLDRMKDVRQKWPEMCCSPKCAPGTLVGITSVSTGSVGDALSSPMSEVVSSQESSLQKGSPQTTHPLLSMNFSNWAPEPVKIVKSNDLAPHHARGTKGVLTNFFPVSGVGEGEVAKLGEDGLGNSTSRLKRDEAGSPAAVNLRARMQVPNRAGYAWKNDLALGTTNVPSSLHSRDLREGGQQPMPCNRQRSNCNTDRPSKIANLSSINFRRRVENLNGLGAGLGQAVLWQKEAMGAVASAVLKSRSGESVRRGANGKSDSTWLLLLGPDRVGKRETAKALSKLLFKGPEQLVVVSGWSADTRGGLGARGKTPLDRLAEAVARQPFSVVLLEDVDRADIVVRKNLIRAMERGMLADSNGRDVNFSNVVVVMTCSAGANLLADQNSSSQGEPSFGFKEDGLLELCPRSVRLRIDDSRSENVMRKGPILSVVECNYVQEKKVSVEESRPEESILLFGSKMFKRKSDSLAGDDASSCSLSSSDKRCKKGSASPGRAFALDLNLPVEDTDCADEEPSMSEEVCQTAESDESVEQLAAKVIECARGQLPKEIFPLLDGTVVFKPFNLDGLTDLVLDRMEGSLEDVLNASESHVEIDKSLLELMVSYAWQTFAHQEEFLKWVDNVLVKTVSRLGKMLSTPPNAVFKLTLAEKNVSPSELADNSGSLGGGVELLLPGEILVGQ